MSHEIRTPLNGVVSMADALSRRDLDSNAHQMVDLIRSSGSTLERLLSDILDSAKIEAGQVTIEPTLFDLKHTVNDIALMWRAKAEDKGVALVFDMDPTAPKWVRGDAVRLRQVLTNLVSNALKFTEAGTVTLSVKVAAAGRIGFAVRDTGIGFDAEQKARIFQRFQQADGSITRRFGGTGLGLAISTALVELMGGELDCDSVAGEGAVFRFEIDLPETAAPVAVVASTGGAGDIAGLPLRILLAEDHPANRKVVEIMLAASAMQLTTVENGRQALELFMTEEFDLVLMDMQMPVMDGLSATTAIRAFEATAGRAPTPIVMLTANAMAEHVAQRRAAGADGHLTKPITLPSRFAAMTDAMATEGRRAVACWPTAISPRAASS
jgi:CheY-like chemotaxis protein